MAAVLVGHEVDQLSRRYKHEFVRHSLIVAACAIITACGGVPASKLPGFPAHAASATPARDVLVFYDRDDKVVRRVVGGKLAQTVKVVPTCHMMDAGSAQVAEVVAGGWGAVLYGTATKAAPGIFISNHGEPYRVSISCYVDFRTGTLISTQTRLPGMDHVHKETKYASHLRVASDPSGKVVVAWWKNQLARGVEISRDGQTTSVSTAGGLFQECHSLVISKVQVSLLCATQADRLPATLWRIDIALGEKAGRAIKSHRVFSTPGTGWIDKVVVAPDARFAAIAVQSNRSNRNNRTNHWPANVYVVEISSHKVVSRHSTAHRVDALELSADGRHLLVGHNDVSPRPGSGEFTGRDSRVVYINGHTRTQQVVQRPMKVLWWETPGRSFWYVGSGRAHRERVPKLR